MTNQDRPHPGSLRPRPPAEQPGRHGGEQPAVSAQDQALEAALSRLDGLDAIGVHEHVEVYAAVDRALRERLAGAEG